MASHASAPQAINGTDQAFWSHFQRIYLDSHLLLKKLTSLSLPSPTEQDLASIQEIPGRFVTAVAAVHSIIPIFSSALAARLQSLEQLLPRYLAPLSTSAIDTASVPDAQLPPTNDELVRLLTSVVVQLPARDDKEAWTAVFTDVETLCGWHRHRELECELRNLREQANRKNAPPVAASLHLSELVRELASLPETVSLSCSPGLRKRLMDYEKSEEVWEKADEERRRAADQETGQRDAMHMVKVLDWNCSNDELATVLQYATARESFVQAQSREISLYDRGLTTRASRILRRFAFLDCSTPVIAAVVPVMPPPSSLATQNGVSPYFLMKMLNSESALETRRNKIAIRELVDASVLILHDKSKSTQCYTMTASTQFALRWRHVADSQEPANSTKSLCDKALANAAADVRKICRGMKVRSGHNRLALEALRHARVLADVPKTAWLKLGWYELCGSWHFVVKLIEECEAKS